MHCCRCTQSFDSRDLFTIMHQREVETRKHTPAVHMHGTGTALPVIAALLAATPLPEVKRDLRRVGFGGCDLRSSSDIRPPFVTSPLGIFIPRIIFRVDVFDAERPNRRHLYDVVTRLRPMEMVCIAG